MTSIRHNGSSAAGDDAYLDAARATILAVGWRRTTLTDVARRAGVSRMTIYRRWADMPALLGDLLLREWGSAVDDALRDASADRAGIARAVVTCLARVRSDALFRKIVEVDPELLLPYLVQRRGRTQDLVLDALTAALAHAQQTQQTQQTQQSAGRTRDGVRDGDPRLLATTLLLALHGFLVSAPTVLDAEPDAATLDDLDAQLTDLVERYLAP